MIKLKNGVFRLKKDVTIMDGMDFKEGQEIELIGGVVYMGGFPLPANFQPLIKNWMDNNQNLLINDTRNF